jgi:hypothetical protein
MEQFGGYLQRKTGTKALPEPDPDGSEDETETPSVESAPKQPSTALPTNSPPVGPSQPEVIVTTAKAKPEKAPEPEIQNPLTVFAHGFRESITSEQWMQLSDALSKTQMKALRTATTALDDDSTADGILAFKDSLKPTQYMRLQRILDEDQQGMISRLIDLIAAYEEEPVESEDEEDPGEDPSEKDEE